MQGIFIGTAAIAVGAIALMAYTIWGALTMRYDVTPQGLTIHFGPSRIEMARDEITEVEIHSSLTRARRLFGAALPGFYQGRWSFAETGPISLYATSLDTLIVIETEKARYGISPENPEAFLQALERGERAQFPAASRNAAWGMSALGVGFVIFLLLFAILFAQGGVRGRIAYELGPDALVIYGGFRPVTIPYATMTGARIDSPQGWPWKSFGTSVPGLHWGSFSWKQAGPNLKLYATRLRPLVLISCGRTTYGISPEDPEAFLAELQKLLPQGS
ncbi:MAG TPA: PH domain-containing protein [Limnochordia bacterium]|nr:PH domain-containing protein [Limnochordia bacterium]